MSPDKLVYMANQIATFFGLQKREDQVERVAADLRDLWDPGMRARFLEAVAAGRPDLNPIAAAAAERPGETGAPPEPSGWSPASPPSPAALPNRRTAPSLPGVEEAPMPDPVPPAADALAAAASRAARRGPPPVHLWNPPFCGDLDMRIARDGTWFYLATPIGRPALVALFASILKREGDRFYLVTPVEKVGITVDDAPFVAVDFTAEAEGADQRLTFETNVGDLVTAGPEHPIRVATDPATGEPAPYVMVRRGLEALIDRKSFYRLAELGSEHEVDGVAEFGLWSGGAFFPLIPAAELSG
jgi:hypothetical protein